MRLVFRRWFREGAEESASLRLLALAATALSALSLETVGGEAWVWLGGPALAAYGHWFSWRNRRRAMPRARALVVLAVLGLAGLMVLDIPAALEGDWLPIARYLVLMQAAASFDLRSRGGLYTVFLLSGTMLFLASQVAFVSGFAFFVAGYFVLFLAFLATASARDAVRDTLARVPWPARARVLTWSFWGAAILGLGVLLFVIMPWGTLQPVSGARGGASVLAVTGADGGPQEGDSAGLAVGAGAGRGQPGDAAGGRPEQAGPGGAGEAAAEGEEGGGAGGQAGGRGRGSPGEENGQVVLRVRSPVASYWRGRTFDSADGRRWSATAGVSLDRYLAGGLRGRYAQTYYVEEEQLVPVLGYSAIDYQVVGGAGAGTALDRQTVYRGLSRRLAFDADTLRFVGANVSPDPSVGRAVSPRVRALARQIVSGEDSLFDRALLITQYLRDNYRFDPSAPRDTPSRPTEEFLFDGKSAGGSFDFAAANALLAEAAGLPARVATGYLPGQFDPLSGAYTVRRRDAHAWAELGFPGYGWVPFDASPRPDAPGVAGRPGLASRVVDRVFDLQVGDSVRSGLGGLLSALGRNGPALASAALALASGALLVWAVRRRRARPLAAAFAYQRLPGKDRQDILAAYRRVERMLRARHVAPRRPAETLADYLARAAASAPDVGEDVAAIGEVVAAAAYSPAGPDGTALGRMRWRLGRIKAAL